MRPVSDRFLRALRGSHRMVARARLLTTYQEGTDPDGTIVPLLDGDVKASAKADIRSTLSCSTDGTRWDHSPSGELTPYGNELFVERGIVFAGGAVEWVSLGYYRIRSVEQDDAPDGPIDIEGQDRMSGIRDARLEAPRQFVAGITVQAVFENLVHEVYPTATIEFDDDTGTKTLARTHVAEKDRDKFLRDLAKSYGKVTYFDHRGVLQIASPPDPGNPAWDVNHGRDGVLVSLSRDLSREGVYNSVVAYGEGADEENPPRAVVRDNNPDSPTYYFGKFGKVPRFYSSPFITTDNQAISAATSMLAQSIGLPHSANFQAIPNPALEPNDPVRVRYGNRGREVHVIDEVTIPLTASGAVTAKTRRVFRTRFGTIVDVPEGIGDEE